MEYGWVSGNIVHNPHITQMGNMDEHVLSIRVEGGTESEASSGRRGQCLAVTQLNSGIKLLEVGHDVGVTYGDYAVSMEVGHIEGAQGTPSAITPRRP